MNLGRPPHVASHSSNWLSPDECARAARFLRPADRHRYVRSHQALRRILSGYLDRPPDTFRFRTGTGGKPELDGHDRDRLHFNLSHSADHALIGLSFRATIGVDIEAIRLIGDPMAIARAHFHPSEIADLERLPGPQRDRAFFACWTRKEAAVKALGIGLAHPIDTFRVSLPPAEAAILQWERDDGPGSGWSMHHLDPGPDTIGAVAIARSDEPCARYRLPPDWATAA